MQKIDDILNSITMYRLVLYVLIAQVASAIILSFVKILPYNPLDLFLSTLFIVTTCYITNWIFSKTFETPANSESVYISALILTLIINPANSVHNLIFPVWAAIIAMASKYIIAVNKKHIFNPAAVALVITAYGINQSASWWVGNLPMLPIVLIGGLLIARKIRRFNLVIVFLASALFVIVGSSIKTPIQTLYRALFISPLLFFAFIMLTEPLTTPPTKKLQIIYGAIVGILFAPQFHILSAYTTPELALVIGNIFSFFVSFKKRLLLPLHEKIRLSSDIFDFTFALDKPFAYNPGQYMEWTLKTKNGDSRGNRRFFTIASSPTENLLRLGVKFYEKSSVFKKTLFNLPTGVQISASNLAGDFTLPKNPNQKLAFIAGGIGVTPYRSIIKYLLDKNEKRDIVLLYAAKTKEEFVYSDIFEKAREIGLRCLYILTDTTQTPIDWPGLTGYISSQMINQYVPDFAERTFYISGPQKMVDNYKQMLRSLKIPISHIKTDYFPGF